MLNNQLNLSYQNFNKIVNNQTSSIKFENLKAICDILECTPNDLFEEYYKRELMSRKILLQVLPKNFIWKRFITKQEIKMLENFIGGLYGI